MRKMRVLRVILVVFGVILLSSCSRFRKIQKSDDWRLKYDAALEYYEMEKYYKANVLLDAILPIIRGTKEAEKANFYYAYTYFYQRQYILSANYFKQFATIYSRSEFAKEASFMHAYSLFLQSPDYNLDQSSTYEAIASLQGFINRYPYDDFADRATSIIDEMQRKLEKKAYENAKQYYRLGRYKAANIAFENFERDFPDSKLNEEIAYLAVDSKYKLAKLSIQSKQEERFNKTLELYEKFIDKYPNSEYLKKAENLYAGSVDALGKIKRKT